MTKKPKDTQNPLTTRLDEDSITREERLLRTVFETYKPLETAEECNIAVKNIEKALTACSRWLHEHTIDKDGPDQGKVVDATMEVYQTFEHEEHLLHLLADTYFRRLELLDNENVFDTEDEEPDK